MLIEKDTTYAYAIKHLQSLSFESVRNIAVRFCKGLSDDEQTELYDMLNRGVDLISNEPQMMMYLHAFGLMHQAKLNYAFEHLPQDFFQTNAIEIIDYGCGQAIGEMVYADYLRSHNISQNVTRITLIEPSETCLKRAALHVKMFFPDAKIRTVCKTFDELTDEDIATDEDSIKLHILSNVLDIESFYLEEFAELIDYSAQGYNQFVCVGPYFNYSDKDERMDIFAAYLGDNISHSKCFDKNEFVQNKSWTCKVCIFEKGKVSKPETFTDAQGVEYGNYGKLLKKAPKELTEYTISDSVMEIGESAFGVLEIAIFGTSYSSLHSITIPNSVTYIGERAFSSCSNLQSIKVDIKNKNFCAVDDVLFNKNKTILIRCSTKYEDYSIPDSVRKIGNGAFCGCKSLRNITIPDSVTEIEGAFVACSSLQSIIIPDSVTKIGDWAFFSCRSLQSITIPDSVTEIGESAFFDCSSLQSITIPDSVTEIGESAFSGCSSLQSIKVDINNENYCAENDVLFKINKTILIRCSTKYKEYTIPDSVTEIGIEVFKGCSSLKSITIPDSVTKIDDGAFGDCCCLKNVNIPDSVTEIGWLAFEGCSSLQSINIPNSVTKIGWYAFSGCSSLQSINISNSVTKIGWHAFDGCISLQSITIPNSVTEIEWEVFRNCNNLQNIVIPDSVWIIGEKTFSDCSSLQSITIPNSVTVIGDRAFKGFSGLLSINIPYSVTEIGDSAFEDCNSLQSINIPDSVWIIGEKAFSDCSSLQSITIPDSVTVIENYAFEGCISLQSINIPDSVWIIGEKAFSDCSSLQSITIPDSVTEIENYAFEGCISLQSINIPDSVTVIGEDAFKGCRSLQSIKVSPNINKDALQQILKVIDDNKND